MQAQEIAKIKSQLAQEFERFNDKGYPDGFPPLPDLPAGRYTDPMFYDLERELVWGKSWLLAGHLDEFVKGGDFKLWREIGAPVVIVRGHDGSLRAFYNTCRHRGGPLVREARGNASHLLCLYHSWTYDLEGNLTFVPDAHEFPELRSCDRGLIALRCETWGNLVFVNPDLSAPPLHEYLGPIVEECADLRFDELRLVHQHHFNIACNWKVAMDAFQEVYHLKHIHPDTVNAILDHRGASMTIYPNGHSRMIVPNRTGPDFEAARVLDSGNAGEDPAHEITRTTSRAYNLFPNIVTPTAEFEFPLLVFWPQDIRNTKMDVIWLSRSQNTDASTQEWKNRIAQFDVILDEDVENLPWIQQSIETPGFESVPLSYQERRIYNHHEQIDRTIGAERLPASLRIPQVLEPYWRT